MVTSETIPFLWPEIILVVMATCVIVGSAFESNRNAWCSVAILSFFGAGVALYWQFAARNGDVDQNVLSLWQAFQEGRVFASGPVAIDFLAGSMRWLALLVGLLFTLIATRGAPRELVGEYLGCLMLITVGVMLAVSANELIFLFVGLELISIPTYVLLFLGRRDRGSAEATVKYFFLSILSSAVLLYGFSFLYGLSGSTELGAISEALLDESAEAASSRTLLATIALVLIFAGLGFKIAAAPFHFYAPDVYQGATNANAGLLAVVPKIAGIVALIRLATVMGPATLEFAWHLSIVLAVVTMTIGNVCALWQKNIRRMMAYSSIAHAGYMLIGLSAALADGESGGVAAVLLYVLVYSVATLGTFAALAYLSDKRSELSDVEELAGLGRTQPVIAAAIAVFMFSLTGIPPLAGFWGKFGLFTSAVGLATESGGGGMAVWFLVLAIVGALNAAVAAAYYLRVVAVMYFRASTGRTTAQGGLGSFAATTVCVVLVGLIGLMPGRWVSYSRTAGHSAVTSYDRAEDVTVLPKDNAGASNTEGK